MPTYLFVKTMTKLLLPDGYPVDERNARLWRYRMGKTRKASKFVFSGEVSEVSVPMGNGSWTAPVRVYHPSPATASSQQPLPVIVWIHGGGWVIGDVAADDKLASKLSAYSGMLVVSISYRLAPEHPYPAAVLDSSDALKWVKSSIRAHGGDAREVYVVGESSGANLAAALVSRNLDSAFTPADQQVDIRGVALMYPPLASHGNLTSYSKYDRSSLLTAQQMERFRFLYSGGNESVRLEYSFAPLRTPKAILRNYPPTIMVLAKHDVLVDDGLVFADNLRKLDVKVSSQYYTSSTHGFFGLDELPNGEQAVRFVADELQRMSKRVIK